MKLRVSALVVLLGLLGACAKQVSLAVTLVTQACVEGAPGPAPTLGVHTFRFLVTVDGGAQPPIDVDPSANAVKLPVIPFDQVARVDVFGLDSSQAVLAFGSSGDFTIPSTTLQTTADLTITLRRADAFSGQPQVGNPTACAKLGTPRAYHAQTLLSDGRVLIYGGLQFPATVDWSRFLGMPAQDVGATYLNTAEIFDPSSGTFSPAGALPTSLSGSTPGPRAFAALLASAAADGGAVLIAGETRYDAGAVFLAGAQNGGLFSPADGGGWSINRTVSAHSHGCVASDTEGHAMVAAGLDQNAIATAAGETLDTNVWRPTDRTSVPETGSTVEARADQACSGFDGVQAATGPVIGEAGGFTTDANGQNVSLLGDLFFYGLQSGATPTFGPLLSPLALTAGARSRAKAAPFQVVDLGTGGPTDALLITGGLTCDTASDAGCLPTFFDGGTAGQLGNAVTAYLPALMRQTELLAFPQEIDAQSGNPKLVPTVFPGPSLPSARVDHCAVALPNQRILVLGGLGLDLNGNLNTLADAYYTEGTGPATGPAGQVQAQTFKAVSAGLSTARAGMACTLLRDGSVLVTGGFQTVGTASGPNGNQQAVQMLGSAEIYTPVPLSITAPAGN